MTIYYQHVGEGMAQRDFPRTLGTARSGVKRFTLDEVRPFIEALNPLEVAEISDSVQELAPTGFQIWGIPSGAMHVLEHMRTGDFLLLLESTDFTYCGQVIHRVSEQLHSFSLHLWGEARFPIIIFLQGELVAYPWSDFIQDFKFAQNYHMRGNTMSISSERVAASRFRTEEDFVAAILTTKGVRPSDLELDFRAFADNLTTHLREVRARERQAQFRASVFARYSPRCVFCGYEIREALEAAHIVGKGEQGSDDARNGLPLCRNHHRLFDLNLLGIDPQSLRIEITHHLNAAEIGLRHVDLSHLPDRPHRMALEWRWKRFRRE
jgi:hypothetical protein